MCVEAWFKRLVASEKFEERGFLPTEDSLIRLKCIPKSGMPDHPVAMGHCFVCGKDTVWLMRRKKPLKFCSKHCSLIFDVLKREGVLDGICTRPEFIEATIVALYRVKKEGEK